MSLEGYIEKGQLVILYPSLDKVSWEKKGKENIKFNRLKGYHVLANDLLIADVWSPLGGIAGRIPRYALVNKDDRIIVRDAARPSNDVMLIKQIEDVLIGK